MGHDTNGMSPLTASLTWEGGVLFLLNYSSGKLTRMDLPSILTG